MPLITAAQLKAFAPNAISPAITAEHLDRHAARCGIKTPRRIRHWMGHMHVESAGFTRLEENLFYSAERLPKVWPKRFPTVEAAAPFAKNPKALANKVYGGRMGNTGPNDGYIYRGGGWIQLTGKDNYRLASAWTGVDLVAKPELARTPDYAAMIAADYWRSHGLNEIVDQDGDEKIIADLATRLKMNERDDVQEATRVINGGQLGLKERFDQMSRAAKIWQ